MKKVLKEVIVIDFESEGEKRVLKTLLDHTKIEEDEAKKFLEDWLVCRVPALNWKEPYTLLDTEEDINNVIQVVMAIIYGVYL